MPKLTDERTQGPDTMNGDQLFNARWIAETQPQLQPALLKLSAMISNISRYVECNSS